MLPTIFSILGGLTAFVFYFNHVDFIVIRWFYIYLAHRWFFDPIINKLIILPCLTFGRRITYALDRSLWELWGPTGYSLYFTYAAKLQKYIQAGFVVECFDLYMTGISIFLVLLGSTDLLWQDFVVYFALSAFIVYFLNKNLKS